MRRNDAADKTAKEALQLPVLLFKIPYTDLSNILIVMSKSVGKINGMHLFPTNLMTSNHGWEYGIL